MISKIVEDALAYATEHHKRMERKGTKIPYMAHLLSVCRILAERECNETLLAAALLHDIVEDTGVSIGQVREKFGYDIATIVSGCTEKYKLDKEEYNEEQTWKERKMHTLDFIRKEATIEQLLVILADKLDNISSIKRDLFICGERVWERFNAPKQEQEWYYTTLVESFEKRNINSELFGTILKEFEENVAGVFGTPGRSHSSSPDNALKL